MEWETGESLLPLPRASSQEATPCSRPSTAPTSEGFPGVDNGSLPKILEVRSCLLGGCSGGQSQQFLQCRRKNKQTRISHHCLKLGRPDQGQHWVTQAYDRWVSAQSGWPSTQAQALGRLIGHAGWYHSRLRMHDETGEAPDFGELQQRMVCVQQIDRQSLEP